MFNMKSGAPFALAALLFCSSSTAWQHAEQSHIYRRQNSGVNGTTTSLEPIIPPNVNQNSLNVLQLGTSVTLAWAGSPGAAPSSAPGSRRLKKRDSGISVQGAFSFAYPTVPLDHSNYVSNVSCSGGSITGTLSDNAYTFVQNEWNAPNILFITSADGCGTTDANEFFKASSVTFSDDENTFTAQGSSTEYKDIVVNMNFQYGSVGATQRLKRAVDKRDMFESPHLYPRLTLDIGVTWSAYLEDDDLLGPADDAPWPDSALLFQWSTEGGEPDDSFEEGENESPSGHHKRSKKALLGPREEEGDDEGGDDDDDDGEDGLSYGLALYCVHCGFGGSADLWGTLDFDILDFSVNTVQAGFNLDMNAGLTLGLEAFVDYEKEWSTQLANIPVGGFEIPLLLEVGPFVSVSLEASAGISATGSLQIGASMDWNAVSILVDLLDNDNSYADFGAPVFTPVASADGELHIEASLGLPVEVGVEISILEGLWTASAGIVDTPSINAEGVFEISGSIGADGTVQYDIGQNGCYGISWDIFFENTLQAVLQADLIGSASFDLIPPQVSEPIASGCIGYVPDGTDSGAGLDGDNANSSAPPDAPDTPETPEAPEKPKTSAVTTTTPTTHPTTTTSPTTTSLKTTPRTTTTLKTVPKITPPAPKTTVKTTTTPKITSPKTTAKTTPKTTPKITPVAKPTKKVLV